MKAKIVLFSLMVSSSAFALDSKELYQCFVKSVNETVNEIKSEADSDKTRLCDKLSNETVDKYFARFSYIKNQRINYYPESEVNGLKLETLYNIVLDDMDCYGNKVVPGALINDLINIKSNNRNSNLVKRSLSKMINADYDSNEDLKLDQFDFSYCSTN